MQAVPRRRPYPWHTCGHWMACGSSPFLLSSFITPCRATPRWARSPLRVQWRQCLLRPVGIPDRRHPARCEGVFGDSAGTRLWTFYIRRALRIFPLYYMTLLLLLVLEWAGVTLIGGKSYFVWNITYLANFKMYWDRATPGVLSHFWTLCVEEQFYLVAPLVLLTISFRKVCLGFIALWIGCVIARVLLFNDSFSYLLSPLQFESMTVGIAAAALQRDGTFLGITRARAMQIAGACAIAVVPVFTLEHFPWKIAQVFSAAVSSWVFAVAVAGLILLLWNSEYPRLTRVLSTRPWPYLGKISYGLYVFHFPCQLLCYVWFGSIMSHGTAIPALVMTVALAAASWHFVERPINDLKRYFPYRQEQPTVRHEIPTTGT